MDLPITWVGANNNGFMVGRLKQPIQTITMHWMDGTLQGTDSWFNNPNAHVAAHYGVADKVVHQYVHDTDTAYGAGNWAVNLTTINIEHQGGPNIPITDATYVSSAMLLAKLNTEYNIPLDRLHIKKHSEVSLHATACPGNFDIDRVISMANQILKPTPPPAQAVIAVRVDVAALRMRNAPFLSGTIVGELMRNTVVNVQSKTAGDTVSGNNIWFKTVGTNVFIWSGGVTPA